MKIWQFKVKSNIWLKNWENEYTKLSIGDSFPQRATLSNKLDNCIGELVLYYNSKEVKIKKIDKGIYLVCKIISNVYEEDDKWIDMEVLFDYRKKPYMYDKNFPELHDYHNTTKIRKRTQNYEYIDTSRCDIELFYKTIIEYKVEKENSLLSDIEEIKSSNKLTKTEKENLVKCRLGQGNFRKELINYWQGCSVTKFKKEDILIASHIKPWKDSSNDERLDVYNGFLLVPNLDKLFDKGYISFDDEGNILISNQITNISSLCLNKTMRIKIENAHKKYLNFHREMVFKK